jgi:hypothetical protein
MHIFFRIVPVVFDHIKYIVNLQNALHKSLAEVPFSTLKIS